MFSCLLPSVAFVATSSQLFQEVNICISCLLKTKFRQPPPLSSFSTSLLPAPPVKFIAVTLIMSRYNALPPQVNLIRHRFFPGISAASAHYHSSRLPRLIWYRVGSHKASRVLKVPEGHCVVRSLLLKAHCLPGRCGRGFLPYL